MRFPPPRLHALPRFPKPLNPNPSPMHPRGRNQWRRAYSARPPPPPQPHFITGDSHFQSVSDANHALRHGAPPPQHHFPSPGHGGGGWAPPQHSPSPGHGGDGWTPPQHSPMPGHGGGGWAPPQHSPSPGHGGSGWASPQHSPSPGHGGSGWASPQHSPTPGHGGGWAPPQQFARPGQGSGWAPQGPLQQQYRPRPPQAQFRHPPPPHFYPPHQFRPQRPPDFREWKFASKQPPPQNERFTVVSYNILADYLAIEHRPKLYSHVPRHVLDWEWRKWRLMIELGLWNSDVLCLQEVDRFNDIEKELAARGYTGIWKMRTGNALDGCAIFWRKNRFLLRHEENIEFNKLGLRDNVAQICVLESTAENAIESASTPFPASSDQPKGSNQVIICNIHVLYNPRRGEVKLGQVRVLLERAYEVSRNWNGAPVILCGDFNSTPRSPLYNFIAEQKLSLSGLTRDQVSGQYSASAYTPRPFTSFGLYRPQSMVDKSSELASGVEQGRSTGSPIHYTLQGDVGDACATAEASFLQSPTDMIPTDTGSCSANQYMTGKDTASGVIASEYVEKDVGDNECALRGIVGSSNEQRILLNMRNDGKQQEPSVSCSKRTYVESIQQEHERMAKNISTISLEDASVTTSEICEENNTNGNHDFERTGIFSGNVSVEEVVVAKTAVDNKHIEVAAKEITSIELTSDTSFANDEASSIESVCNVSTELTTEQEGHVAISYERTSKSSRGNLFCPSPLSPESVDLCVNEVSKIIVEDSHCDLNDGTSSSSVDTLKYVGGIISSQDKSQSVNSIESNSDVVSQYQEKTASGYELHNGQLDDPICLRQGDKAISDLCHSEENSDPDFFKDLLGKEHSEENSDPDFFKDLLGKEHSEENSDPEFFKNLLGKENASVSMEGADTEMLSFTSLRKSNPGPSSTQVKEDSSSLTGPHYAGQEHNFNNQYNPYLWTPMDIKVASGKAECSIVEHNLKLRSAYTDVEDYAGTKDSNREPQVTSYHRQFMGTVDYIWYSEGLQTVKVLDTLPKHVLQRTPGFPTQKWGSDHLALACQFSFAKG